MATVGVSNNPVHSGAQALQITTALLGNANSNYSSSKEVYLHTEATIYFNQQKPTGFSIAPPYNLNLKQVLCYVFIPASLLINGNSQVYIRLFVKDTKYANDFSKSYTVDSAHVNTWFPISFTIEQFTSDADPSFDATQVNTLGVRVDTNNGSTLDFTGSFDIDDCTIQHP